MICGKNDWDEALDEARQQRIARGEPLPGDIPAPQPAPRLEDYGRSIAFSLEELCIES